MGRWACRTPATTAAPSQTPAPARRLAEYAPHQRHGSYDQGPMAGPTSTRTDSGHPIHPTRGAPMRTTTRRIGASALAAVMLTGLACVPALAKDGDGRVIVR